MTRESRELQLWAMFRSKDGPDKIVAEYLRVKNLGVNHILQMVGAASSHLIQEILDTEFPPSPTP